MQNQSTRNMTNTSSLSLMGTCNDWVYTIINVSTVQYAILRTIVSRKHWPTEETIPYNIYGKLLEVKRLRRRHFNSSNNLSHLQYSLQLGIRLVAGLDYYLSDRTSNTITKSSRHTNDSSPSSSSSSSIQQRRICEYWTEIEIKLYQQYCVKQLQSSTRNNDTNNNNNNNNNNCSISTSSSIKKAWYDGPKYSTIDLDCVRSCPVFTQEVLNNDTPLSCPDQSSMEQIRVDLIKYVNQYNNSSTTNKTTTNNNNNMPLFDSTPNTLDVDTDDWMYLQTNINDTDLVCKYGTTTTTTTTMNVDTSSKKVQSIHNDSVQSPRISESTSSVKKHKSNNNDNINNPMVDTKKKDNNSNDPSTTTLNHLSQMMDGVDAFFQSKSPIVEGVTVVPTTTKNKSNTIDNNIIHDNKSATAASTSSSSSTKNTTTTSSNHQESKNDDIDIDPVELMNILYKTLQLQTPEEVSTYLQSLDTNDTYMSTSSRKDIEPTMDGNTNSNDNADDDMFFRREDYDAFDNNDNDSDDDDDLSDDENVDDEGWMNTSGNDSNIQGMLNEMNQMDIELAKQGVSLSRPSMNDGNDNDEAQRAKVQMHLLSNMLQSIQSTNGGTGPFNNILAEQGIVVPEHLDELIVDSDDEHE